MPGDAALRLPAAACLALCEDLPRAAGLDAALRIVEGVRRDLLGQGLLTVHLNRGAPPGPADGAFELQRLWTSDPGAYPVAGRKRKPPTPWTEQLLRRGEVFVGQGEAALAQAFDDHRLIASLGWRAVVNVPLLDDGGTCFATFNVLGPRPSWQPAEVMLVRLLAQLAWPAVRRASENALQSPR